MTTSHTAKSSAGANAGLTPLDSASGLVLARVDQLDARFDTLEQLLRTQHAPTAMSHHLLQLEESMLLRLKFVSEMLSFMMNKTGGYLQEMSQATAEEESPMAIAMEAFKLASEQKPVAPNGGDTGRRKAERRSKTPPRR